MFEEIEKGENVKGVQAKRHRIWMKQWRETKIKIMRLLTEFEEMVEKMVEEGEGAGVEEVREALKLWKEVEEEMCFVPGYSYVPTVHEKDEEDRFDEIGVPIEDMVVVGQHEVAGVKNDEECDNFGSGIGGMVEISLANETNVMLPAPIAKFDLSSTKYSTRSRKAQKDLNSKTSDSIALAGVQSHNAIESSNEIFQSQHPKDNLSSPSAAKPEQRPTRAARNKKALSTPRSVLGISNTPSKNGSTCTRRAVILLDTAHHIPHPGYPRRSYSYYPTEQPHNTYTTAETTRGRRNFQRSCALYTPGTWASPDGCEKVDTSLMKADWEDVERMWAVEARIQEIKLADGLEISSWYWVFVWWFKPLRSRGTECKGNEENEVRIGGMRGWREDLRLWF
jgi:hypothetical protein